MNKIASSLIALVALLAATANVQAQHDIRHIPPIINAAGKSPDLFQPYIEPGTFNHDLQFFAPFELESFDDRPPEPIGFYLTYDRLYISMTNPEATSGNVFSQDFGGEKFWGNRFTGGYMTEENHGWDMTYFRFGGGFGDGTSASLQRVIKSNFYSIDLNKTFRKELHHGAYIESFIGPRYIHFSDIGSDSNQAGTEMLTQNMKNYIFAAQVGTRFFKQKGRWTLSGDIRFVAGANIQHSNAANSTSGNIVSSISRLTDEFVPMGELRLETAYHVTRDLSIRFGVEMMHFIRGINRADMDPMEFNLNTLANRTGNVMHLLNDQDLTLAGISFGIEWNH